MKPALKRIDPIPQQLKTAKDTSPTQVIAAKKRTFSFDACQIKQSRADQLAPADQISDKAPELPNFNCVSHHGERQDIKPILETNPMPVTQIDAAGYEVKLEQIVRQIEDLYSEGPIVDGWLEFQAPALEPTAETPSQDIVENLADSVEEFIAQPFSAVNYYLCGMNESGQKWSYPCPAEQISSVSLAIARYQKLQQLLKQKHDVETHLSNRAE